MAQHLEKVLTDESRVLERRLGAEGLERNHNDGRIEP